jgi:hypothetical protein
LVDNPDPVPPAKQRHVAVTDFVITSRSMENNGDGVFFKKKKKEKEQKEMLFKSRETDTKTLFSEKSPRTLCARTPAISDPPSAKE